MCILANRTIVAASSAAVTSVLAGFPVSLCSIRQNKKENRSQQFQTYSSTQSRLECKHIIIIQSCLV